MADKWVYHFEDGNKDLRDVLGGKGAGPAEMTNLGLPVPPGFTITTETCLAYLNQDNNFPESMWQQTIEAVKELGGKMGREFAESSDPFQSLDIEGVGQLIITAVKKGRRTRPDLEIGICGEHGGDPDSIEFFNRVGLNYVSCSPYRLPIARLAAARAALKSGGKNGYF